MTLLTDAKVRWRTNFLIHHPGRSCEPGRFAPLKHAFLEKFNLKNST